MQAVAAQAGIAIMTPDFDYGVDGTFRPIKQRGSQRVTSGFFLDFQLKAAASTNRYRLEPEIVRYRLEVQTYNDLVDRQLSLGESPCILLLVTLGSIDDSWLTLTESELLMKACYYYVFVKGDLSANQESVTIQIPRTQRFTPQVLRELFNQVERGQQS